MSRIVQPAIAQQLVIEFWGGECGFKLRPLTCGVPEDYRIFRRNPYGVEDGIEYGRILLAKPKSNVLRYAFSSWGLDFFKQDASRPRPAHIIDSYAVYHKTKKNNQYTTGKACHIYRTWAEDSHGVRVWCDLEIRGNEIRQTIPAWFIEAAYYPVYVDPTIGKTDLGATPDATGQYALANPFVAGANGDAHDAYIGADSTAGATVYAAVYEYGDGNISGNARFAVSSGIVVAGGLPAAFYPVVPTGNMTWNGIVNGTTYFLEVYSNTTDFLTQCDTTTGSNQYTSTGATGTPPDPHATRSGTQTLTPSIYVDYTESGGGGNPWYVYAQQ